MDSRTLQSPPERGGAGYHGRKRHKGSKVRLAGVVTPANESDRAQVAVLDAQIQEATVESVEVAFVAQGYTGEQLAANAEVHEIRLIVRFRRPVRDYERWAETPAGL